jgi:hypothetical protein
MSLIRKARTCGRAMHFTYVTILRLIIKLEHRLKKRLGKEKIISIENTPLDGKIITLPVNTT